MKRYYKPIRQIWHKPTQQQQAWLLDRGSLTERLQQAGTHFEVRLVEQGWRNSNRYPNWFAQMLQNKRSQFRSFKRYWFREVQLWLNDQCMVTAISYTPAPTMQQQAKFLTKLSNRSLGSILFSNRRIQRGDIVLRHHVSTDCWSRASIFYLQGQPMLVSEYFHPCTYELSL